MESPDKCFLVYTIWFHKIVHDKRCLVDNSVWQTENYLERGTGGFVKHWL